MQITFDDVVALQSTSAVYKMKATSAEELPIALKCVGSVGGQKSIEHEWSVLQHLAGVGNITEAVSLRFNVVTSEEVFPKGEALKTILVQRFFKAAPLNKLFCMFPTIDESIVKMVVHQLVTILDEVHQRGVVYVDLKLPNILLRKDGVIKLVDFGSSVVLSQHYLDGQVIRDPFLRGTVHVRAPELLADNLYLNHPMMVDVWALGVCTYEMLCGKLYEPGKTETTPLSWPSHVSSAASEFVTDLLKVEPKERLGFECLKGILTHPFLEGVDVAEMSLPEEYEEEVEMQTLGL